MIISNIEINIKFWFDCSRHSWLIIWRYVLAFSDWWNKQYYAAVRSPLTACTISIGMHFLPSKTCSVKLYQGIRYEFDYPVCVVSSNINTNNSVIFIIYFFTIYSSHFIKRFGKSKPLSRKLFSFDVTLSSYCWCLTSFLDKDFDMPKRRVLYDDWTVKNKYLVWR